MRWSGGRGRQICARKKRSFLVCQNLLAAAIQRVSFARNVCAREKFKLQYVHTTQTRTGGKCKCQKQVVYVFHLQSKVLILGQWQGGIQTWESCNLLDRDVFFSTEITNLMTFNDRATNSGNLCGGWGLRKQMFKFNAVYVQLLFLHAWLKSVFSPTSPLTSPFML